MNTARSQQPRSLNVFGNAPRPPPANRQSKAKRFFQKAALPSSVANGEQEIGSIEEVDGKPAKPIVSNVPVTNADDPFHRIEQVTDRIGALMTTYESEAEQSRYRMLQDLDSNFQINNYDPGEIISESKRAVDDLIGKNRKLKETQNDMLDALSVWFSREEQALRDADLATRTAAEAAMMPTTTDDILAVVNSTTGTTQDKIAKIIQLHGDIVSKTFIAMHQLERKNMDQEKLIRDLQRQNEELTPKHRRQAKGQGLEKDLQRQLEVAMTRIHNQEETIKRLNERVEQLIGQSVLSDTKPGKGMSEEESLMKTHDMLSMEIQIDKQTSEIADLKAKIAKLNDTIQALEADKSILESQNFTLQNRLDIERSKYDALQRQYLDSMNKSDPELDTGDNDDSSKFLAMQDEIAKLKNQIEDERRKAQATLNERIRQLKREFEVKELEWKKRQIPMGGSHQQVLEALQHQHEDEMRLMQKHHEAELDSLKREYESRIASIEAEFNEKLKEFQRMMKEQAANSTGQDGLVMLKRLEQQAADKELELKQLYMEKMDQQRSDFEQHLKKLEAELALRGEELARLNQLIAGADLQNLPPPEPVHVSEPEPPRVQPIKQEEEEEEKEEHEVLEIDQSLLADDVKEQINKALADYAIRMEKRYKAKLGLQKKRQDEFWNKKMEELMERANEDVDLAHREVDILKDRIADLEGKIQAFDAEREELSKSGSDETEKLRKDLLEALAKVQEMEASQRKLEIENDLMKQQIESGNANNDLLLADLNRQFAEQTRELNQYRERAANLRHEMAFIKTSRRDLDIADYIPMFELNFTEIYHAETTPEPGWVRYTYSPKIYTVYFEIMTAVEPRLREAMRRMRKPPTFDPKSLLGNDYFRQIDLDVSIARNVHIEDTTVAGENKSLPKMIEVVQERPPLYISPLRGFHIDEDLSLFKPVMKVVKVKTKAPALELELDLPSVSIYSKKMTVMRRFKELVFEVIPPPEKLLSFAFGQNPVAMEPMNPERLAEYESARTSRTARSQTVTTATFERVSNYGTSRCEPIDIVAVPPDRMSVAVGVKLTDMPAIVFNTLEIQEPLEIFGVKGVEVRPQDPVIIDPSVRLRIKSINRKSTGSQLPIQLLTRSGDLVDIPPISEIDQSTSIVATKEATKMALQDASEMTRNLGLVVSELQAIEQEVDPVKKMQLQETLGVSLDVEKDSILSQMRERITELEQMMNRVGDEPQPKKLEIVGNISIDPQERQEPEKDTVSRQFSGDVAGGIELVSITPAIATTSNERTETVTQTDTDDGKEVKVYSEMETETEIRDERMMGGVALSPMFDRSPVVPTLTIDNLSSVTIESENMKDEEATDGEKDREPVIHSEMGVQLSRSITPRTSRPRTPPAIIEELPAAQGCSPHEELPVEQPVQDVLHPEREDFVVATIAPEIRESSVAMAETQTEREGRSGYSLSTSEVTGMSPKKGPSLTISATDISVINGDDRDARATSPLDLAIFRTDAGVGTAETKHIASIQSNTQFTPASGTGDLRQNRVKMNMSLVPTAARKAEAKFTTVTTGNVHIDPVDKPMDPRIALFSKQQEQISDLKRQLLHLQFSSPADMPHLISEFNEKIQTVVDDVKQIPSEPTVKVTANIKPSPSNPPAECNSLRAAIETSSSLVGDMFARQAGTIRDQNSLYRRIIQAVSEFLKEMDQPGGAAAEKQSRFLTNVSDIASEFSSTIARLQAEINGKNELVDALDKAMSELTKQEEMIQALKQENIDLKLGARQPKITTQLRQVHDELENMIAGSVNQNQILKSEADAKRIVPHVAGRGKCNNIVRAAGASSILERVEKLASAENPNWRDVSNQISDVIAMVEAKSMQKEAQDMVLKQEESIKKLEQENQKLTTDLLIAERDMRMTRTKLENEVAQLTKALDLAKEQNFMLERQLGSNTMVQRMTETDAALKTLQAELSACQQLDKQRLADLVEAQTRISDLEKELTKAKEDLTASQEKYEMLFSQATDTETANQALKSKTDEIVARSEIEARRSLALEQIRSDNMRQMESMAGQMAELTDEKTQLQKEVLESHNRIAALEQEVLNARASKALSGTARDDEVPRVIKAYQQRLMDYMNQLQKHGNDLLELRARHATDSKQIIMMGREVQRVKGDLRMQQLRYDCAKQENDVLIKALAGRDETIRMLKREITRLRNLLKMQGPLKEKLREFQKEQNDTEMAVIDTHKKIETTKKTVAHFRQNNQGQVANYFDGLLRRQQETLARLERKRREMREAEERSKIATLRAVSYVVKMAEVKLPEELVFQMMPRPAPVLRLQQQKEMREEMRKQEDPELDAIIEEQEKPSTTRQRPIPGQRYRTQSYADTLAMLGELVGQKSPRTLQTILRDARHNRIAIPAPTTSQQGAKKLPPQPVALSIKPMRR